MLKHHKKLKKLWNKAPKINKGCLTTLDRRYKASKEFETELVDIILKSVQGNEERINQLVNVALKDKK